MTNRLSNKNSQRIKSWKRVLLVYVFFLLSGLAVVFTQYFYQKTFIVLEQKYKQEEALKLKWTQYMLELSSLKTYERVDTIARKHLGLFFPSNKDIHLVN